MISLNAIYIKLLLSTLYTKKEKNIIYTNKLRNIVKTILNNVFIIFVIFKNNAISI